MEIKEIIALILLTIILITFMIFAYIENNKKEKEKKKYQQLINNHENILNKIGLLFINEKELNENELIEKQYLLSELKTNIKERNKNVQKD